MGEWSRAGAVVWFAPSSRPEYVIEFWHWLIFGIPSMPEKVGLTIDFLYNTYVLEFPQNPNITCKNPWLS